ncbi:MAG TPA: hypothetical protein VIW73_06705 [Candidatus Cybelea sp.]
MKRILAFLLDLIHSPLSGRAGAYHNDALRANQFKDPANTFGYWRSLVS